MLFKATRASRVILPAWLLQRATMRHSCCVEHSSETWFASRRCFTSDASSRASGAPGNALPLCDMASRESTSDSVPSPHSAFFSRLVDDLSRHSTQGQLSETCAPSREEWQALLAQIRFSRNEKGTHSSSSEHVCGAEKESERHDADDDRTLSLSEAAVLLEHALHAGVRRMSTEDATPMTAADAHARRAQLLALYETTRRFRRRAESETTETLVSPSPHGGTRANKKKSTSFSAKGMYYSCSFALLLEAQRVYLRAVVRDSDAHASTRTEGSAPQSIRSVIITQVLPLVDAALKILLVDAPGDDAASATRPSSLVLAMAAVHTLALMSMCACRDLNEATASSAEARVEITTMPFVFSAIDLQQQQQRDGHGSPSEAASANKVDSKRTDAPSAPPSPWPALFEFVNATAAACARVVISVSPQISSAQEAIWLWMHTSHVCADAAVFLSSTVSPSSLCSHDSKGAQFGSSARSSPLGEDAQEVEVESQRSATAYVARCQRSARVGSPLLRHIHTSVLDSHRKTDAVMAEGDAEIPCARLVWNALLTTSGRVSLVPIHESSSSSALSSVANVVRETCDAIYTLTSQEAMHAASSGDDASEVSEACQRVECALMQPFFFLTHDAMFGQDVADTKQNWCGDSNSDVVDCLLGSGSASAGAPHSRVASKARGTIYSSHGNNDTRVRERAVEAFFSPFPADLSFRFDSTQDQERMALVSVRSPDRATHDVLGSGTELALEVSLASSSRAPQSSPLRIRLISSLATLFVRERLHQLEALSVVCSRTSSTLDAGQNAAWHNASVTLIDTLSRLFLLIGQLKQKIRVRGQARGRRHTTASSCRRASALALSLPSLYRVEQTIWFSVLSAVSAGYFAPTATSASSPFRRSEMVMDELVLPLYDHRQWRAPTVNVFLSVLGQWRKSSQMRDVFRVVFLRETALREAILVCIRHDAVDGRDSHNHEDGAGESATRNAQTYINALALVLSTPPALNLHSCEALLNVCCGGGGGARSESHENVMYPFMAAQVVEYALCRLHWLRLHGQQQREQQEQQESSYSAAEFSEESETEQIEGRTLAEWRRWVEQDARTRVQAAFTESGESWVEN